MMTFKLNPAQWRHANRPDGYRRNSPADWKSWPAMAISADSGAIRYP